MCRTPAAHDRDTVDELPDVSIEGAEFALHLKYAACVVDRRFNLQPIADYRGVPEQSLDPASVKARDSGWVELLERRPVALPLCRIVLQERPAWAASNVRSSNRWRSFAQACPTLGRGRPSAGDRPFPPIRNAGASLQSCRKRGLPSSKGPLGPSPRLRVHDEVSGRLWRVAGRVWRRRLAAIIPGVFDGESAAPGASRRRQRRQ
jgi:hypothetical protein